MLTRRGTTSTGGKGQALPPVQALRRLVSLAVLVGFVAMHGLSADHDVHLLASLSGHSHATPAGAGTATTAPAAAAVPAFAAAAVTVADAGAWLLTQARPPADGAAGGHGEGCLLALTVGVLAFVLAVLAARGRVPFRARPPSRPGSLLSRRPPRPSAPCLFALGVLRT
jgi:hypothetical protein